MTPSGVKYTVLQSTAAPGVQVFFRGHELFDGLGFEVCIHLYRANEYNASCSNLERLSAIPFQEAAWSKQVLDLTRIRSLH